MLNYTPLLLNHVKRSLFSEHKDGSVRNVLVSDDTDVTLLTIYDKNEIDNVSDEYIRWLVSEAG